MSVHFLKLESETLKRLFFPETGMNSAGIFALNLLSLMEKLKRKFDIDWSEPP